jgi:2-methylcitrate dehydratase PrpD
MAAGSRQNFGTAAKPVHAGLAARNALSAADLAAAGVSADERALEGPYGFLALFGETPDASAAYETLTGDWLLGAHSLNRKRYPCCYGAQRTAEAAVTLAQATDVAGEDIERVDLTVEPEATLPLVHPCPRRGAEARFSAQYVVAAALLDGEIGLGSFTDEAVARPEARSLMARVTLSEAAEPPFGAAPSTTGGYAALEVRTTGGDVHRARTDDPLGHATRPLDDPALDAKFHDCAGHAARADAEELLKRSRAVREPGGLGRLLAALREAAATPGDQDAAGDWSGSEELRPPSTGRTTPVTQRAAGLAR